MSENLQSPLNEVEKNSLAELFARDPEKLTKEDLGAICVELRAQRAKWQVEDTNKQRGVKTPKATLSQAEMDSILDNL